MNRIRSYFMICIFVRLLICYLAYKTFHRPYLHQFWYIVFFIISMSFLYQFITKYRNKGAFNQDIWWDFLRPFHSILFLISGYLVYIQNDSFIYLLLFDVVIGTIFHIKYRYIA